MLPAFVLDKNDVSDIFVLSDAEEANEAHMEPYDAHPNVRYYKLRFNQDARTVESPPQCTYHLFVRLISKTSSIYITLIYRGYTQGRVRGGFAGGTERAKAA